MDCDRYMDLEYAKFFQSLGMSPYEIAQSMVLIETNKPLSQAILVNKSISPIEVLYGSSREA